ncbi:hypothetical protein GCM10027456_61170 [Kineosporia babensis]
MPAQKDRRSVYTWVTRYRVTQVYAFWFPAGELATPRAAEKMEDGVRTAAVTVTEVGWLGRSRNRFPGDRCTFQNPA